MLHVGLDLSRRRLDVCVLDAAGVLVTTLAAAPDVDGLRVLAGRFRAPVRGVVESMTGARFVHDTLEGHGWVVEVADAQRVKALAPLTAKTDRIDAALIAEYGAIIQPRPTPKKSRNLITIRNLLARRRQLVNLRTQERNRCSIMGKAFEASSSCIICTLDVEIVRIEKPLVRHTAEQAKWCERQAILQSTPGVGDSLIYTFLAELPVLGELNNR